MPLRLLTIPTALMLALLLLTACQRQTPNDSLQGYVEGEYLYLAAPQSGYLKTLAALRGSRVMVGQAVFTLDSESDQQALTEAEARADAAKERVVNLQGPRRPSEIAALEANLRAAEAGLRLTASQLAQQEALLRKNFIAASKVDEARSAHEQANAQVEAARQQIASYRNTLGRRAEVSGAAAEVRAAAAQVAQKRWLVEKKSVTAPAAGEIFETYYQPGEWVPAGSPVASLLPDDRRRVRFFVAEPLLAALKPGAVVAVGCDGCGAPIQAYIDFISPKAEYTPPVIYSRGAREKLLFRVEAVPAPQEALQLRPGLPVDVRLSH